MSIPSSAPAIMPHLRRSEADSEVGQGTTVKIYLPRLEHSNEPSEAQPSAPVPEGTQEETILVVEDDDSVRTYSVDALHDRLRA